ncbi:MAG: LmbE family protein [Chitinophagaceae bacterium]|nr:LmbE family protein [Chitinophagaceae bacterium]
MPGITTRPITASVKIMLYLFIYVGSIIHAMDVKAQHNLPPLNKVLTLAQQKPASGDIPQDHGLDGIWQTLLKLQTTASVLHTQAHPDDEQADLLTYLARGKGVRTSLLSLNRGESGSNILGMESFDQLGLLRTEEFLLAASYYGLDDLYFTNLVDYGYSKRVEEAYEKWGRQNVLSEMVRVIRINRPLVIISRFHGSKRDGHGNHQAAGEISPEAFKMAADPNAFPEQITKEGLRPWKTLKFYRGGVNANEHWNIALNTGVYCPWLGESYKNFSSLGYSFHRSQFGGQRNVVNGDFKQYYERLASLVKTSEKEAGFFDGIDTTIGGIFKLTGEPASAAIQEILYTIERSAQDALAAFKPRNQNAIIPYLTSGLAATRKAIQLLNHQPEARFLLQVKERQFMDAINEVLGINLQAIAMAQNTKEATNFYEPPATMGFAVPSQMFKVFITLLNRNSTPISAITIKLIPSNMGVINTNEIKKTSLQWNEKVDGYINITVPANAPFSKPYWHRGSLQENNYQNDTNLSANLPRNEAALQAYASYRINDELVVIQKPVQVRQANLPYGFDQYNLKIAPALAVNMEPKTGIILKGDAGKTVEVNVELVNNQDTIANGTLKLNLPSGWQAAPASISFSFTKADEKNNFSFKVSTAAIEEKIYEIKGIATINGVSYSQGYDLSTHRDLDQTLLYRDAAISLKGIDVKIVPALHIGYVMGAGDEVPAGIRQLGAEVQLLTSEALANAALNQFDVIVIGTRAYAVRQDLNDYNQRLLDYAKNGGHLLVLFQTPEFIPGHMAPYPAQLPDNSEEVSEENSPVKILDSNHRVFNFPNKISNADFDNWVEQRGSKFFSSWDTAYTPMISTQDIGQSPQSGGWLMASFGKGYYTYFAYSLHRQLPNGITGVYKILANLLSYGKK